MACGSPTLGCVADLTSPFPKRKKREESSRTGRMYRRSTVAAVRSAQLPPPWPPTPPPIQTPKQTAPPPLDFSSKLPPSPAISGGEIACPGAGLSRAASPHSPPTAGSWRGRGCCRPPPPARAHSSGGTTAASPTPPRFGARSTPPFLLLPPAAVLVAALWVRCGHCWLLSAMCLCFCLTSQKRVAG
jgi:hypothetical protein